MIGLFSGLLRPAAWDQQPAAGKACTLHVARNWIDEALDACHGRYESLLDESCQDTPAAVQWSNGSLHMRCPAFQGQLPPLEGIDWDTVPWFEAPALGWFRESFLPTEAFHQAPPRAAHRRVYTGPVTGLRAPVAEGKCKHRSYTATEVVRLV